ncbi:MAG: patatin-like phospholipase family protein [Candidatus Hydrogenedentes bacterium]|nr:patatin-like phospholipase family protein [Candidatus Hydrogenedentota bacterium]
MSPAPTTARRALEPIAQPGREPGEPSRPAAGVGLCLSGGGYRATLFHLGTLWRLNELGMLHSLSRLSSVSGGSILSAYLGLKWKSLAFDRHGVAQAFGTEIVEPIRAFAEHSIDVRSIFGGLARRGSIAQKVVARYRKFLFGDATLQDLPNSPRFVINATCLKTGVLWRFSKPYMRNYLLGRIDNPDLPLAVCVAASSAFPPVLSPLRIDLDPARFVPEKKRKGIPFDPADPKYARDAMVTDGGVYDNLGLETVWKRYDTVLVSDAGGKPDFEAGPHRDWARHTYRVLLLINEQVHSLRVRQLIDSYEAKLRKGAYWGIRTDIADYDAPGALCCPHEDTMELAATPTRLKKLTAKRQKRLINWGYAVCDAAIRTYYKKNLPEPTAFPYPAEGVGDTKCP